MRLSERNMYNGLAHMYKKPYFIYFLFAEDAVIMLKSSSLSFLGNSKQKRNMDFFIIKLYVPLSFLKLIV